MKRIKAVICISVVLFALLPAVAQTIDGGGLERARRRAQAEGRKSVGLVLSGGGAKGVAHISAIMALEAAGIPIDYIAGTSMGAIIGGLYAIGYDSRTLDSMVRTQDWNSLIYDRVSRRDLSFIAKQQDEKYLATVEIGPGRTVNLPSGIITGRNVYNLLYELTFDYHDSLDFYRLPIPFACMGYDMVSGKSVPLTSGSLPECIRASMSIPGAFHTVNIDDMVLVDGGMGNNFPVDIVRQMGAEIVVGIDVSAPLKTKDELTSFADIFDQITSFTALDTYERNLQLVDLYIHPDITGYSATSFSPEAIDTLLNRGRVAMEDNRDKILALRTKIGIGPDYRPVGRPHARINPPFPIGEIRFEGLRSENERVLRRISGIEPNSVVTGEELLQGVNRLMGTNTLTDVQYRLEGDSVHSVVFSVVEAQRNTLSAGLRFDTEEMAAILLNMRYATPGMTNSYFDLTARLSKNPYGRASFVYGNRMQRVFNASFTLRSNDLGLYSRGKRVANVDYMQSTFDLSFSNIRVRNFSVALGVRGDYYDFGSFISREQTEDDVRSHGLVGYYARAQFESLDSRSYPVSGTSISAAYRLETDNFIGYAGGIPFSALQFDWFSVWSVSQRLTIIPGAFARVIIGDKIAYIFNNFMGGAVAGRYVAHQIPFVGLSEFERFRRSVTGVRLDARLRVWKNNFVSLKANYARHDNNFFDILGGDDVLGVGINWSYRSFIGPIDFLIDYSTYDKKMGIYFNLGYYF